MPRKLTRPKLPSGAAPGVISAKVDQRRVLVGRLAIVVWLMLVEKSACSRLMSGDVPDDLDRFSLARDAKPDVEIRGRGRPPRSMLSRL